MVWNREDHVMPPTPAWRNLDLLQFDMKPFRNEDLFGERNSAQDWTKIIKRLMPIAITKMHSVNDWKLLFNQAFKKGPPIFESKDGENLRRLAVKMAASDPRALFEKGAWKNGTLNARHDTVIWRAAYDIFGAPWTQQEHKDRKRLAIEVNRSFDMETEQPKATNIESTTATVKITNTNVSADKPRNKENNEISERNNTATTREETATQQNKINANTNNRQGNKSAETKKNLKQTQIMTASKEAKETARNTSRKAEKNSTDSTNQRDDARTTERDTNTEQIAIDKNKNTETRVDKGTSSNKTSNETGEQAEGMEIEKPTKLFLSKPLYQKNKKTKFNLVNPDLKRKHETFYKCKLPRCTKESIMEGNQELVEHFHVLFRQIFKIDPTTIILPWNTDSHTPPFKKIANYRRQGNCLISTSTAPLSNVDMRIGAGSMLPMTSSQNTCVKTQTGFVVKACFSEQMIFK